MARYMRSYGKSYLKKPVVIGAGIAWHGPGVYLTSPASPNQQNRRAPHSKLRPPRVVTAVAGQIFFGPSITYWAAVKSRQNTKGSRRGTTSTLRPPAVVGAGIAWHGPGQYLTRPKNPPAVHSALRAPAVVTAVSTGVFYGPSVHLTRRRPPLVTYDLGQPVVVTVGGALGGIGQSLAPSRRPQTKSLLRNYIVAAVVVQAYYGPAVHLARSRRPVTRYILRRPTDTIGLEDQGRAQVHLAPSKRGKPRSALRPPTVVFLAVEIYGPEQWLAYSRRGTPTSFLRPPTDTVGIEDQGKVSTHLAPQRRGVPKSRLEPPVVVFLAVEIYGPEVHLTRIKVPLAQSILRPPVVVGVAVQALYGPELHLTYSLRGRPIYRLEPPTVVFPFFPRELPVALAPQRRGVPKSRLEPPQVVFLAVEIYGPEVTLIPSRRPITKSRLEPPTVVAPVVSYGPFQWLTYSRRGTPTYFIRPPQVVASPPAYQQVLPPTFAPQRRGRPKSILRKPTRVFPVLFFGPQVTLRPQRRGIPKSILRGPRVVRLAVEIYGPVVRLARIKPKPTTYFLKPPTDVVDLQDLGEVKTWLTYSRRGKPIAFRHPEVVGKAPFRGIQVHLARIKPRPTVALLKPPSVVRAPEFFLGPELHLTRIKVPLAQSNLKQPTVVGAGIAFYGPFTWLVRIKHPPVYYNLPLVLVRYRRPHGDVCGFDITPVFICSLELPTSQVSGSTHAGDQVSGSSRATSKISGSESAGGSVSGSDRKAT